MEAFHAISDWDVFWVIVSDWNCVKDKSGCYFTYH